MGCDIHVWLQEKPLHGTEWHDVLAEELPCRRDYLLFGVLAGVREEDVPHPDPRGWPYDLDGRRRWNNDYHTPSWLTLAEFRATRNVYAEQSRLRWGNEGVTPLYALIDALIASQVYAEGYDYRIIFAFDN